jgi:hypothetical protein
MSAPVIGDDEEHAARQALRSDRDGGTYDLERQVVSSSPDYVPRYGQFNVMKNQGQLHSKSRS